MVYLLDGDNKDGDHTLTLKSIVMGIGHFRNYKSGVVCQDGESASIRSCHLHVLWSAWYVGRVHMDHAFETSTNLLQLA